MSALLLCRFCDTYQKARFALVCEKCGGDDLWREPEEDELGDDDSSDGEDESA